jgi:hypothetical protein
MVAAVITRSSYFFPYAYSFCAAGATGSKATGISLKTVAYTVGGTCLGGETDYIALLEVPHPISNRTIINV